MLSMQKRGAEAQDIYNSLLARDPLDTTAAAGLATSLMLMERYDEAVTALRGRYKPRRRQLAAVFSGAAGRYSWPAIRKRRNTSATRDCAISHMTETCLALLGTAWRLQGNEQDETLNGYDSLIRFFDLDPARRFFRAWKASMPNSGPIWSISIPRTQAYLEQSPHGGSQTEGHLFGAGHALVEKLRTRIEEAIFSYVADLVPDDRHPFLARRSSNAFDTPGLGRA